ncbi:DUF2521 family protein [Bacillus sp. H-16]|uniref:DUF2521 family protein n=1 Tax=Alteribacter salitolerans TaxID=2912333 RepID=UPI0019664EC0|nr:DUF2521 family protein [Alteribacter salitolerans]MBM7096686.1 DUF2521 family protein [Alteribacter salitolerans]
MNLITSFSEKRRKKQWNYERRVLRSLSISDLRKDVHQHFMTTIYMDRVSNMYLEDFCVDIGIDAFLLGSEYGRFGYFGETAETVKARCMDEIDIYAEQSAGQFYAWLGGSEADEERYKQMSEAFVHRWWEKGFNEGVRRYKMKLH